MHSADESAAPSGSRSRHEHGGLIVNEDVA
jgi:hypothetical protein